MKLLIIDNENTVLIESGNSSQNENLNYMVRTILLNLFLYTVVLNKN